MLDTLREKANNLPQLPGVYIMLDEHNEVIYVGKAKKLKNRVTSYFRGEHLPKVAAMVEKVRDFNVIVANSEFEALVLENSLIKRHKPHYNILLKDDKSYPFIRVDIKSEYPRLTLSNKAEKDGAKYFGPYGGRGQTKDIINTISKALLLPDCGRKFPRDIGKDRVCLNYHMGVCAGWCQGLQSEEDYKNSINQAILILEGKSEELISDLNEQMLKAADELRFENAAKLRDRLRAIEGLANKQKVISTSFADTDAIGFCRGAISCFIVLHFVNGDLISKDTQIVDEPIEEDDEAISDFIRLYYCQQFVSCPKTILIDRQPDDKESLERLFAQQSGRAVSIETPKRGDRAKLVETANTNAREEVQRRTTAAQRTSKTLEWLQKALDLKEYPKRIEAFDISNLGDTGIVAAMTVHVDGKPLKRDYRKFRVKDLNSQDDYASMHQVVYRRFKRYLDGDASFSSLPQLLLIDGGDKHTAVAKEALDELGMSLPVFGMVKDERHRTRALVTAQGKEIGISGNQAVFSLIGSIQEETHRTAIEYQRSIRNEAYGSRLDEIEGVGPKRRDELIKHFKSLKAIRSAALDELCQVVPKNIAQNIYNYFHDGEEK